MSEQDYGAMTEKQQEAMALALYQLTPEQLVKVVATIAKTLDSIYGVQVIVTADSVLLKQ